MNSFLKRTLSGAVLVAVMVGAILWSPWSLLALVVLITAVSMREFLRLGDGENRYGKFPIVLGIALVLAVFYKAWYVALPLFSLPFIVGIFRKNETQRIGKELTALIYIALPMSLLTLLGIRENGYYAGIVLFYVILIWINDVGAYLVGITLGKHRLCERLSPKKSWEGFFGGLVFTVLAAIFLGPRMTPFENTPLWGWIIFGVVLTLSAVAGDLVESMFKREAGVKDSGNIIPGHGGFLDRFDAMFISLPFVYVLVQLI